MSTAQTMNKNRAALRGNATDGTTGNNHVKFGSDF
jgi:hypothetical protein